MRYLKTLVLLILLSIPALVTAQKGIYLREIKRAAEKGLADNPGIIATWKKEHVPNVLWGYNAPAHPVYLASTLAFLYEVTGERQYAESTATLLASYGDLRNILPKGFEKSRAEYAEGVPSISNFFFIAPYIRAYLRIRESGVMDRKTKEKIERELAGSADYIFHFPEWGTHNRAMLRAEALRYAALAMPDHPHAARWSHMASVIASDNLRQWEIEDASLYHPIWLLSLLTYIEASKEYQAYTSPVLRYYFTYFQKQINPLGMIPDYGDARWNSSFEGLRWVPIFEKGAAILHDPELKWAAQSILAAAKRHRDVLSPGEAYGLTDAFLWADESIPPAAPTGLSQDVLEDLIGKKVIFRNGWDSTSTYMMLNYRDEGDGGWLGREFLRQTISVEEEKMHHGHSDENSIVQLVYKGSPLLHDAGYRDGLPSGQYGAWRQDYFHNRLVARKNKRDATQSVLEFVRNSGAYRQVRTRRIDMLNLQDVDMSRTRLIDEELGYTWDRVVTFIREQQVFVVIDGISIQRPDYFTFTNFWHGQRVLAQGKHYVDIGIDSIQQYTFPSPTGLLVYFPETYAKKDSIEPIRRQDQTEHAVYQTIASQYKAGDVELFVTILVPHDRRISPESLIPQFRLTDVSAPFRAVGLEIGRGAKKSYLCVKLDLSMEVARENIRPRYPYELGRVKYGDFETDAHFMYATIGSDSLSYSASNMLKVLYKGKPLFESLPNTHGLQLDGEQERVGYVKWRYWEDRVALAKH